MAPQMAAFVASSAVVFMFLLVCPVFIVISLPLVSPETTSVIMNAILPIACQSTTALCINCRSI